jgi:two-component system CheB/CheR fusion protein
MTTAASQPAKDRGHTFPVVGIGSSAGGLRELIAFFSHAKADTGAAYVVVSHLSPDHESRLPELLQKETGMNVVPVTTAVSIRPNTIYVISPKSDLDMRDGTLQPHAWSARHREMTIDRFFTALATAHGKDAFAIVLSGTGSDGTNGTKAIREAGGVTFAQEPADAEYDSMPRNAIGSGSIDFVMNVQDMPAKIAELWRSRQSITLPHLEDRPTAEDVVARAEDALRDILSIVRARTGHDFSQYKRATLLRRIERRMQVNQLRDLPTYRDYVRETPTESRLLLHDLLISVTSFFRDPTAFAALEKQVIPALFSGREHGGKIRAWVAGCATGEEAYSLAILLHEENLLDRTMIYATDINPDALRIAQEGIYDTDRFAGFSQNYLAAGGKSSLSDYYAAAYSGAVLDRRLKKAIVFTDHSLATDNVFAEVQLASCRNVLIYFEKDLQERALAVLTDAVARRGFLGLGIKETLRFSRHAAAFTECALEARIYRKL